MIDVVCVKVGTKYGAEYVNRLGAMVGRHLSLDHTFHCVTEDPRGVDANILEVQETELPGWWQKLTVFKPDPWGLRNPILFFDLHGYVHDAVPVDDGGGPAGRGKCISELHRRVLVYERSVGGADGVCGQRILV